MLTSIKKSAVRDVDFVPVAAVFRSLDALAKKFGFAVEEDNDDELGTLYCAYLQTEGGRQFALCRYRSYPNGVVDLLVPSEREHEVDGLREIIRELAVAPTEIRPTERHHRRDRA
jgi:hypothetical protein